jgi:ABC-type nitrate/sulfonate/bicarbonate transport system ATPase subunit
MIAGLGKMSAGSIDWKLEPRKLAFVFQEAALMPWATVQDNVRLPLKLAGVSKRAASSVVAEAIALVGLQGFEGAYAGFDCESLGHPTRNLADGRAFWCLRRNDPQSVE